jgi:ATP-dependent DNA ligase
MLKIRRERTLDCVVIGWREHAHGGAVGSLILGLYQPDGEIRHGGHSAGFPAKRARELVDVVTPLETGEVGEPSQSRWSGGEDTGWRALRPELVAEVKIDHASDGRIRHGARLIRFRDDKPSGHGSVDMYRSIVVSCDTYYYVLASETDSPTRTRCSTRRPA